MGHQGSALVPVNLLDFSPPNGDISINRDVTRKTYNALGLNFTTCVKITKLVDAIAKNQCTGLRRWMRSKLDDAAQDFKQHIESLAQKEHAWPAVGQIALTNQSRESYTKLGEHSQQQLMEMYLHYEVQGTTDLHRIDRSFRVTIVDPLKRHLLQSTPPDYARLLENALPLGQEALRVGDSVVQELTRLQAKASLPMQHASLDAADHSSRFQTEGSRPASPLGILSQHPAATCDTSRE